MSTQNSSHRGCVNTCVRWMESFSPLCIHTKSHTSAKSWKVAIGRCQAVPIVHSDSVLYVWMSVQMDTISQRKCNWGDNGWMIGTGHKQFFCQGYKAWLRKLSMLTDPCQNRTSALAPPVCWSGYQWRCFPFRPTEWDREVFWCPSLDSLPSAGASLVTDTNLPVVP